MKKPKVVNEGNLKRFEKVKTRLEDRNQIAKKTKIVNSRKINFAQNENGQDENATKLTTK